MQCLGNNDTCQWSLMRVVSILYLLINVKPTLSSLYFLPSTDVFTVSNSCMLPPGAIKVCPQFACIMVYSFTFNDTLPMVSVHCVKSRSFSSEYMRAHRDVGDKIAERWLCRISTYAVQLSDPVSIPWSYGQCGPEFRFRWRYDHHDVAGGRRSGGPEICWLREEKYGERKMMVSFIC